jgi:RIO-like serine/threonine protein kinase
MLVIENLEGSGYRSFAYFIDYNKQQLLYPALIWGRVTLAVDMVLQELNRLHVEQGIIHGDCHFENIFILEDW